MKEKIAAFLQELILYDYILFGATFTLFLLFIILGIILRERLFLALFLIIFAFLLLILAPTLGYIQMHKALFSNSLEIISQKKLTFVEAVIVKGRLKNESKFDFSECKIKAQAYKVSTNPIKSLLYPLNPFQYATATISAIPKDTSKEFQIIIEPFTYQYEYNISIGAKCK